MFCLIVYVVDFLETMSSLKFTVYEVSFFLFFFPMLGIKPKFFHILVSLIPSLPKLLYR